MSITTFDITAVILKLSHQDKCDDGTETSQSQLIGSIKQMSGCPSINDLSGCKNMAEVAALIEEFCHQIIIKFLIE